MGNESKQERYIRLLESLVVSAWNAKLGSDEIDHWDHEKIIVQSSKLAVEIIKATENTPFGEEDK